MHVPISITAFASLSPLGVDDKAVWSSYQDNQHLLTSTTLGEQKVWVASLPTYLKKEIEALKGSDAKYKNLDNTVLYAIYVARKAMAKAGWKPEDNFGINLGSSRGATGLFEQYHKAFLATQTSTTLASPTTTLGNVSSWVAHDLQTQGPEISHSITCSTALHAVLNGIAWISAGMASKFLVGGTEAPLTPFTIAQMKALKIYSTSNDPFPCRALDISKKQNGMVLGEGAAVACLEKGNAANALALIEGVGYATEPLTHNISISTDAVCFQRSMAMALENQDIEAVDVIVMHAPGTIKGDLSEQKAISKIFNGRNPFLTTNKWKIGHTFGASGMLSMELALLMLQHQKVIAVPYIKEQDVPQKIQKVLVNAVGFGGNAVSVLLSTVSVI